MEPEIGESKPKRQLTEVQRLAFLKGREKRLANIEKRRQEQIEEKQHIEESVKEPSTPPPKPKRERKPRVKKTADPPQLNIAKSDIQNDVVEDTVQESIPEKSEVVEKAGSEIVVNESLPKPLFTDSDYEKFSIEVLKRLKMDPDFVAATAPKASSVKAPKPPRLKRQTNKMMPRSPSPPSSPPQLLVREMTWM